MPSRRTASRPGRAALALALTAAGLGSAGCPPKTHWERAAAKLDQVAAVVDEYGTASVSEPLVFRETGQFAVEINRPVTEYIDAARTGVQGTARRSQQRAFDLQQQLRVRADVTALLNPLLPAGATPPAPPTDPPAGDALPAPDRAARGTLSSDRFTAPLEVGPLPAALSERQALLVGLNDKVTEQVLRLLLTPGDSAPPNKRVYVGILQVSCQPGWRTRTGYVADVSVSVSYAREQAASANHGGGAPDKSALGTKGSTSAGSFKSSLADPRRQQPFVISVFPSLEAQTLDLRNSLRSQVAFANQLALVLKAGAADAQAQQVLDYARRLENDFASRNPIPLISSYSNGAMFGYQIRPTFQALGEPESKSAGADQVLHPVSFPALILLVAEKDEVEGADAWTHLELLVNSRWVPAGGSGRSARYDEARRVAHARMLDEAMDEYVAAHGSGEAANDTYLGDELRRRVRLFESAGAGITRYSKLPPAATIPPAPTVIDVQPRVGWLNAPTVLAIAGDGFANGRTPIVKQVTVGGVPAEFTVTGPKTLVAVVPAGSFAPAAGSPAAGAQAVTVVTSQGAFTSAAPNTVSFTLARDVTPPPTRPTIVVQRDVGGRVAGIVVSGDANVGSGELLAAIRAVLEREACCEDVKVEVNGNQVNVAPRHPGGGGGGPSPHPATAPATAPVAQ